MRGVRAALAAATLLAADPACAERLILSLSTNEVAVGPNYVGDRLVLFGVVEPDAPKLERRAEYDAVVTLRGPRETLTVRQKEELGPVWINRSQQKFVGVPTVLGVFSSRKLEEIASPAVREKLRLGLEAIVQAPEFTIDRGVVNRNPFRAALIRLKRREGLWMENERGVVFVTRDFFRAALPIPATAAIGNYDVEVLLMSGGTVLSRNAASFEVVKTGLEEQITAFSQDRALVYGLMIGGMSLVFGWIASVIFRRD